MTEAMKGWAVTELIREPREQAMQREFEYEDANGNLVRCPCCGTADLSVVAGPLGYRVSCFECWEGRGARNAHTVGEEYRFTVHQLGIRLRAEGKMAAVPSRDAAPNGPNLVFDLPPIPQIQLTIGKCPNCKASPCDCNEKIWTYATERADGITLETWGGEATTLAIAISSRRSSPSLWGNKERWYGPVQRMTEPMARPPVPADDILLEAGKVMAKEAKGILDAPAAYRSILADMQAEIFKPDEAFSQVLREVSLQSSAKAKAPASAMVSVIHEKPPQPCALEREWHALRWVP